MRFQAAAPNRRGTFPGVFALMNGLAAEGRLTPDQESFRRASYDWYDANLTNPSHVDPTVYDRDRHPGAEAWFKASAQAHLAQAAGHLEVLAGHGVACVTHRSSDPGTVVYEDEHQVVVVPHPPTAAGRPGP